jgi:hypothetical protein
MGNNYDITELLRTKSFSDLDPEEKTFVLNQLKDAAEYKALRNIVLESKDDLSLNSRAKESVMAAFDEEFGDYHKEAPKNKRKFWPYIAAAASIIVLLVIGSLLVYEKEDQFAENKVVQKKDSLNADTLEEPEEESDLKDEELEKETTSDAETEQIAELKTRDDQEILPEEVQSEEINEIAYPEEVMDIQADEMLQNDMPNEEIAVFEEKAPTESVSTEAAKSKKAAADEASALSEVSTRAVTSAETQRMKNNFSLEGMKNKNQWVEFKLKRINKDHYTSY